MLVRPDPVAFRRTFVDRTVPWLWMLALTEHARSQNMLLLLLLLLLLLPVALFEEKHTGISFTLWFKNGFFAPHGRHIVLIM